MHFDFLWTRSKMINIYVDHRKFLLFVACFVAERVLRSYFVLCYCEVVSWVVQEISGLSNSLSCQPIVFQTYSAVFYNVSRTLSLNYPEKYHFATPAWMALTRVLGNKGCNDVRLSYLRRTPEVIFIKKY